MKTLFKKLLRLVANEDGPTAVEYAVMLMLVILVCLTGITLVGQHTATRFEQTNSSIEQAIDETP